MEPRRETDTMKIDIYNAWEHLRVEEEDERRLLAAGLLKRVADGEWHFSSTCFICRHWVYGITLNDFSPFGECRHDPPTISRTPRKGHALQGVWPHTRGHHFCGAIDTRLPEQELAQRIARYCADCREISGQSASLAAS